MKTLLSAYRKDTQELVFRVYGTPLPEPPKRRQHYAAHFAALDLLGAALAEDFGVYRAKITREGLHKPVLVHDSLHMNISHCKYYAVAAVGYLPLGVDVEPPRKVQDDLLRKVCTPEECHFILSADDRDRAFSRIWTLKESYAKFTGAGLSLNFSLLGFAFAGERILFCHPAKEQVRFVQLPIDETHILSLCYPNGFPLNLIQS